MTSLADLPLPALLAIVVLIAVQVGLQIVALVSLSRLPSARVSLGGRKWLWALIVIAGEIAGPISYFVAGRLPSVAAESAPERVPLNRPARLVDVLYGPRDLTQVSTDQNDDSAHGNPRETSAQAGDARRRR